MLFFNINPLAPEVFQEFQEVWSTKASAPNFFLNLQLLFSLTAIKRLVICCIAIALELVEVHLWTPLVLIEHTILGVFDFFKSILRWLIPLVVFHKFQEAGIYV